MVVLFDETTREGQTIRRLYDLKLRGASTPLFVLTWAVFHTIHQESALYHLSDEEITEAVNRVIVIMTGYAATYAQNTHARHMYGPQNVRFAHKFADVVSTTPEGQLMVDCDKFHITEPVAVVGEEAQQPTA